MAVIPEYGKYSTPWRKIIQRLLPPGPLWDLDTQPALDAAAEAMITQTNAAHNAIRLFVLQAFPWTVTYLLDEWIEALDIPWPCSDMPTTDDEKRALIAARIAASGGQTPAYYVDVAAAFGIAIVIVEWPYGLGFRTGRGRCGHDRLGTEANFHIFEVQAPSATSSDDRARLECLIEAFKPAQTVAIYSYTL